MRLERLRVLSDPEIRAIHEASIGLLESVGVEVNHPVMLDRLAAKGLPVDRARRIVRFPRPAVEDAVARVPRSFEVFDREGTPAFVLGDGTPRVAAGHNAVFWVDADTGQTRPSRVADVERFARICESLPGIDMIGIPVMPQDGPEPAQTLLYGVRACIENSRKPIYFSTDNGTVNRAVIELLKVVFPGDMREKVYGISQLSPTSPLFWEEGVLNAILDMLDSGVPLAILPEPNAGVSAPFTLAGLLTVNNVECLSGIALVELLRPGTRVLYANSWTTTDMRTGAALVGSVETSICRIAGAQLARFYRVPCHTTAPNSDNHAHDEQNAWEKTYSQFCALAAGNDLIVNCGMFATGMTCSHEQLILDEEISNMGRRLAEGIEVNAETIAEEVVREIGPHGAGYLTADHTLARLRTAEYFVPRVAVRGSRALWEAAGSPDSYDRAVQAAKDLDRAGAGAALDGRRRERIAEYLKGLRIP